MICDLCKTEPAVYGDGMTANYCAKCYYEQQKSQPQAQTEIIAPVGEGIPHQIKEGLVSIILPVYNTNYSLFHYTGNCIGSIREHTSKEDYELIVVDNGSPIKVPNLQAYYADKVIQNTENLGVTKAWNQGIRASFGEYIVLLNNDTQVFQGWLEEMKKGLETADLVMAHPMYSLTEPFARATESRKVLEGTKKFDALARDFSCVMFKKSLLDELGLFDEQFISWCSDADLLKRMDQAGKTYKMLDQVAIHHISDATGYSMGEEAARIMDEDKERFKVKWERREMGEIREDKGEKQLIRSNKTGDKIFLRIGDKVYPIKNPLTLETLGYKFGDEVTVESITESYGEEIDMGNVERFK